MIVLRFSCLCLLLSVLTACVVTPPVSDDDWPEQVPPKTYYLTHYADDKVNQQAQTLANYLDWVEKFYYGSSFYPVGWISLESDFLNSYKAFNASANDVANMKKRTELLGKKISAEWAKASKERLITTRHIIVWGRASRAAQKAGLHEVFFAQWEADVNALLNRTLLGSDVKSARYRNDDENSLEDAFTSSDFDEDF